MSLDNITTSVYCEKDKEIIEKDDTGQDNRLIKEEKKIRRINKKINI